ncbi:hypothetical protein K432DRAFT_185231 [Lepidopterella palustris CBS 459.81]|uniref:Uncharacterized protein n=1 Tax=Lepidopterella palustris CBS 459.81 TaxID=1314670 RepID=A0A8E2E013_9PEZI|nr:hypothetical protein K432DRAFT_185231 [Lepidopterella palustris CBS 459.81]
MDRHRLAKLPHIHRITLSPRPFYYPSPITLAVVGFYFAIRAYTAIYVPFMKGPYHHLQRPRLSREESPILCMRSLFAGSLRLRATPAASWRCSPVCIGPAVPEVDTPVVRLALELAWEVTPVPPVLLPLDIFGSSIASRIVRLRRWRISASKEEFTMALSCIYILSRRFCCP